MILENYTELQKDILQAKVKGVSPYVFTRPHTLHLTVLMLDLRDPGKLELAKKTLQSLERMVLEDYLGAKDGEDPDPITLSFKGVKTFSTKNPQQARIIYVDVVKDDHFNRMQQITSHLIQAFLDKGVTSEKQLDHVRFDKRTGLWSGEFHLTMMKATREMIDAKTLMDRWGDAFLGKFTLQDIQLSCRGDYEDIEHGRMAKDLFKQFKDSKATYACEAKILLSYDLV